MTTFDRWFLTIFCVLLFGAFFADMLQQFNPRKLSMVLFPFAWAVLTALHELGHAVAARMVGWRVAEIVVGSGRVLKRWKLGDTVIEMRLIPLTGYVMPIPPATGVKRLHSAFVSFAGPGVELLFVLLAGLVVGWDALMTRSEHLGLVTLQTACVAALTGAVINLIPHYGPKGIMSDGMGVLTSLLMTDSQAAAVSLRADIRRMEEALLHGTSSASEVMAQAEALAEDHPAVVDLHLLIGRALARDGHKTDALLRLQAARRVVGLSQRDIERINWTMTQVREGRVGPPRKPS